MSIVLILLFWLLIFPVVGFLVLTFLAYTIAILILYFILHSKRLRGIFFSNINERFDNFNNQTNESHNTTNRRRYAQYIKYLACGYFNTIKRGIGMNESKMYKLKNSSSDQRYNECLNSIINIILYNKVPQLLNGTIHTDKSITNEGKPSTKRELNPTNVKYYQYSNNFVIPSLCYCHSLAGRNPESSGTYNV
jgi:hypothetical protein